MPGYFNAESVRNGYYKAAYREDLKESGCFHQEDSRKSVQLDNTPFIKDVLPVQKKRTSKYTFGIVDLSPYRRDIV